MSPHTTHMSPVSWQPVVRYKLYDRVHRALQKDLGVFLFGRCGLHNHSRHQVLGIKLQPVQHLKRHKAGCLLWMVSHGQTNCVTPLQAVLLLGK